MNHLATYLGLLGLTSMVERVRLLHGNLRVTTEAGRGTEILVRVPRAEQAESHACERGGPAAHGPTG
jgi:nitrate/nitrite-specific signal transduction histidine kinase